MPISGPGVFGHLLDTDHQHRAGALRLDRLDALMDRGRAGGAGVLDPGRGLETELVARPEEYEEAVKSCGEKPALKCPSDDLVDVLGADPRMGERLGS